MFRAPDSTQLNRMSFSCDPVFIWPHDVNTVNCDVNIKFNIVYLFIAIHDERKNDIVTFG